MGKNRILAIILSLTFLGCDSLVSLETHITGDISVIDSNDEEGGRYGIVIYNQEGGYNENIINDYIVEAYGNDNDLFLKCLDRKSCKTVYYIINHHGGHKPLKINNSDSLTFAFNLYPSNKKYFFQTNHLKCP